MDTRQIIKIGIGAALVWYGVLRGARGLIVRVKSWSFRSVNANNTISLNLNVAIKNPLLVGITIKNITGDVYIQGVQVGRTNTSYDYYLAGGKTHIVPVVLDLNISDIGQAALQNIQTGDYKSLTIAFDGKLIAGKYEVAIPIQFELDYNDLTK